VRVCVCVRLSIYEIGARVSACEEGGQRGLKMFKIIFIGYNLSMSKRAVLAECAVQVSAGYICMNEFATNCARA